MGGGRFRREIGGELGGNRNYESHFFAMTHSLGRGVNGVSLLFLMVSQTLVLPQLFF